MTETTSTNDADSIDSEQLAADVEHTIKALADELDADADAVEHDDGGMFGMSPSMALDLLLPLVRKWAESNPEEALRALARVNAETDGLIREHSAVTNPLELLR